MPEQKSQDELVRQIRGTLLDIWDKLEKWQQGIATRKEFEALQERMNLRMNRIDRLIKLGEEEENDG